MEPKQAGVKGLDFSSATDNWGFKGNNYLFLIGIDAYTHWPPLNCAVKDIEDFRQVLLDRYQFSEEFVITLKNEEATEQNILRKFKELAGKITEQDNLVVYFSGHGHYDEVTKSGYWIPVNAQKDIENEHEFVNTAIIVDKLRAINSLHTFLIIDACFSGTLMVQLRSSPRDERYKSRRILSSGRAEVVSDGPKGGNSPFAKGLLSTLTLNSDPYIRASKLIIDVKDYVAKEAKQVPRDAVLLNSDDQGGDFVFHLKLNESEFWSEVVKENKAEGYKKFIEHFPESDHIEEAKESYDWVVASNKGSLNSLQNYIDKYRDKGGKYLDLAIKNQRKIESEILWQKTIAQDTISGYNHFIYVFPKSKHVDEARRRLNEKGSEPEPIPSGERGIIEDSDEGKKWQEARRKDSFQGYLEFTRAYPDSGCKNEAVERMTRLDNLALNRINILVAKDNISLKEKIETCYKYFEDFPGGQNANAVKKIKDQLEISKIKRGL